MNRPKIKLDIHLMAFKEICAILDRVSKNTDDKFKILGSVEARLKIERELKEITLKVKQF